MTFELRDNLVSDATNGEVTMEREKGGNQDWQTSFPLNKKYILHRAMVLPLWKWKLQVFLVEHRKFMLLQ